MKFIWKNKKRLFMGLALAAVALLVIMLPTGYKQSGGRKPEVKAASVSEISFPKKQGSEEISLTAQGVVVMDLRSGMVLFDKNPHERLKPASLTKIMTALVAMDFYQEDSVLKVHNGPATLGNTVDLVAGDELSAQDILYALLVPSGNDAAVTLAENYPGGYQKFVTEMNQKVAALGLRNTHFANVSGVESTDHYTSAYDMIVIAREALDRKPFTQIVGIREKTITSLKGVNYDLVSTNILLSDGDIFGVKTGWTPEAGECLVILAERDNHPVVISLLKSEDRFGEGRKLVDWVYRSYSWE